jgi:hypothetical protein
MNTSVRMRHVCADARLRPRGRALSTRTLGFIYTDVPCPRGRWVTSTRSHRGVRTDTLVSARTRVFYPLGNFIMDATVRPSHRQPIGHCPTVRPRDNPACTHTPATSTLSIVLSVKVITTMELNCTQP